MVLFYLERRLSGASIIMQNKIQQSIEDKTKQFFKTVEAGDIALYSIIPEAIAIFGYTKVGKTSSCHIMCGSTLKGQNQRGELIYRAVTGRFSNAKIGLNPESETEIPNIFETIIRLPQEQQGLKTKKIAVLDQPGYGDTYGFHRIYSNGYFHYRTFSKTPKLKFILAFKKDDLTGSGEYFKKTIFNFINTFNDWESISEQIHEATSFLITKADVNTKLDNLRDMVLSLRNTVANLGYKQIEKYQAIIDRVLKADRLFFIEKPKNSFDSKMDDKIIQQVYDRSKFFERQIVGNAVNMEHINFSVAREILGKLRDPNEEVFLMEYESFMRHTNERVKSILKEDKGSLINIIETLKEDTINNSENDRFLSYMANFTQEYYKFREDYSQKREVTEVNIFKEQEQGKWITSTNEQLDQQMRSEYFIRKFNVLEYLEEVFQKIAYGNESVVIKAVRSIQELEEFSSIFIGIFRKFSILRLTPTDKTIYKYSYIIQRVIEEYKILTLIFFSSEGVVDQIVKSNIYMPSIDLFVLFQDEIATHFLDTIVCEKLKEDFIRDFKFQDLSNITQETINFFEGIKTNEQQVKLRISSIIIKYSEKIYLNDKNPSDDEKRFIGQKLYNYRNDFYAYMLQIEQDDTVNEESKNKIVETIIELTNRLGFILKTLSFFDEAIECFKSINSVESVFSIYEAKLKENLNNKEGAKQVLLNYGKDAIFFNRKELALKCYQGIYELCSSFKEKKAISGKIVSLCTEQQKDNEENIYLKRLENSKFCLDLENDIRDRIQLALQL